MLSNNILSEKLQKNILNAISIFHPYPMTVSQYSDCFGDCDNLLMLANIKALINQKLINEKAIRVCNGEPFISLSHLKLNSTTE